MVELSAALQPDLTECDREPIHLLGRVQSFGGLIAVNADRVITHCSANAGQVLGFAGPLEPGGALNQTLLPAALALIEAKLQLVSSGDEVERSFSVQLTDQLLADVALYRSGDYAVIEFERHQSEDRRDYVALVRPMLSKLVIAKSVERLTQLAAQQLQTVIGFDRVMVYKFEPDGAGNVVAECCAAELESFQGLRFPATDIPVQARALYKRNLLRIISDSSELGAPILAAAGEQAAGLDLSLSFIRAVSPVHLEYLRNMGVAASMSLSILKDGELWGLFACHHYTPRVLSLETRSAADLFAQMFSLILDQHETEREKRELARGREVHDCIMLDIAKGLTIDTGFAGIVDLIKPMIAHDGAIGWVDGRFQAVGQSLDPQQFVDLVKFLDAKVLTQIYYTDELVAELPSAAAYAHLGAGILVLPGSRNPRDYIVLFRSEMARSVNWAGDPAKAVTPQEDGLRMTPRKSFAAWQQVVRGKSAPWSMIEVQAAEALRVTLLEVVLRMTDATLQERRNAEQQQEVLIAELNHRVRNILNLVRSLIGQSQSGVNSVSDFTAVVGQRVHALARAHDLITKGNWSPSSAHQLIRTEADAYLGANASRMIISGPDPKLTPEAITTFALVIHELMTNSVKYGAMSQPGGALQIVFSLHNEGGTQLLWEERGGPPITAPPVRRGFGSTLIERSIPFELGGTAKLDFAPGGLRAQFTVPARHVTGFGDVFRAVTHGSEPEPAVQPLSKAVLLVEDNILIALDAEDMLITLGATDVQTASSVLEAFQKLDVGTVEFAVLDVNLGGETTEAVAHRLSRGGVPFLFATGYGETAELTALFPGAVILQKPYEVTALRGAINRAMALLPQR